MNKSLLLLSAALLLFHTAGGAQSIRFVDPQAQGLGNGSSWTDAYPNLHTALLNAQAGDALWLKQGVYHTADNNDRAVNFHLKSGVKLYGGFAGDETELAQRDWAAHPTIFDGDIGLAGDSTDNTYNLLYLEFPNAETEVNGIVFRNAVANKFVSEFNPTTCGAAIFINGKDSIAYPLIKNCSFISNTCNYFGGAVYVNGNLSGSVAPRFHNCLFQKNNAAGGFGGAVYRNGSSWIEWPGDFKDCTFDNNHAAGNGGAIFFGDAPRLDTLQIENCMFIHNFSSGFGGAFYTGGRLTGSVLSIKGSFFEDNTARIGGAINFYSDEAPIQYFLIDSCTFQNNHVFRLFPQASAYAPAMSIYSGSFDNLENAGEINIKRCHISETDTLGGDEMSGFFSRIEIAQCSIKSKHPLLISALKKIDFHDNYFHGAGVYASSSQFNRGVVAWNNVFDGGLLYAGTPYLFVNNLCKNITFNIIYLNPPFGGSSEIPSLVTNNIFYNIKSLNPEYYGYFAPLQYDSTLFSYNLISDLPNCDSIPSLFVCGPGNLFGLDPLFADTAAGDFHLLPCSPAINAGLNDFYLQNNLLNDLDGNPRILDGLTDMGPYESPLLAAAAPPAVRPACPGTASGAVLFDIDNACSPLAFLWSGDNGAGSDTSALAPGMYQFTITDQQGKVLEMALAVGEATPPLLSAEMTPASCPDCPDGAITASAEGGYPPFSFLWSTGSTGESIAGVPPGVYDLSVTDAAGCVYTDSLTLLAVGTDDAGHQPGCRLFPNPAHDATLLLLAAPASAELRLCLADANGRTLRQWSLPAGADRLPLPLDGLNSGVYWLWLRDEERVQGVKLLRR